MAYNNTENALNSKQVVICTFSFIYRNKHKLAKSLAKTENKVTVNTNINEEKKENTQEITSVVTKDTDPWMWF